MPRHNLFSNEEMRDMVCIYAKENFNGRRACRRYLESYPNRLQPNHKLFKNLYDRLGDTGSFRPKRRDAGRPTTVTPEQEEDILLRVTENPEISLRRMSAAVVVPKSSIHRLFHNEKLYPYHFSPVQNLLPADFPDREQFCLRFLDRHNDDPHFLSKVLFTDEATFTRRGVFNFRNKHVWDNENPHVLRERHFQHEFKINIWCGIVGNHVLGPVELPYNLNGRSYLHFLEHDFEELIDDLPLNVRHNMFFMQDGAPAHFSVQVRNYLNAQFPQRWIGRGSTFSWPARSPDLNPMDFSIWGILKSKVYSDPINTRDELWQAILNARNLLRNEETLFNIRQSFIKRIRLCINVNGGHIENLM